MIWFAPFQGVGDDDLVVRFKRPTTLPPPADDARADDDDDEQRGLAAP